MIIPLLTRLHDKQREHAMPMERFYKYVGLSRQGYFQAKARQQQQDQMMGCIEKQVKDYRRTKDKRSGSTSLFFNLGIKQDYDLGINKFAHLMRDYGLSLKPLRTRVVTTQSTKQSWNYDNLVKDLTIRGINELVVGDLTYVIYGKDRYFLFLLTDVYSARIVGWEWSTRMRAQNALGALRMWNQLRGSQSIHGCIHHTDGGSQYFSELYLGAMKDLKLQVSVARSCLDNGFAEQRNGLMKHHLLPVLAPDLDAPRLNKELYKIIHNYNHERKQKNLGWMSPAEYENYWKEREDRPKMELYDREQNKRTERFGF